MHRMSNANSPRHRSRFQYRLRFFHRCRSSVSQCCDLEQIDRFQIQGSAIESTCGAPVVVVLIRYKHDPESGLSRECQRAQFAPAAASFAVKVIAVPAERVLSYMDQPLLQQPRLLDSQGRNLIHGPDVSPDGSIYATPLEKNGIAHINNFCIMYPYTDQAQAAASGSGHGLGPTSTTPHSGTATASSPQGPMSTARVRAMLGRMGSDSEAIGAPIGSGVMQDDSDSVHFAGGELCLLVQLLRKDPLNPGRWFAYDMPHLISRPFQVVSRSALHSLQPPSQLCSSTQLAGDTQSMLLQGRGLTTLRHSVAAGFGAGHNPEQQLLAQPQRFMSPQPKRHLNTSCFGAFGATPLEFEEGFGAGPGPKGGDQCVTGLPAITLPQLKQPQQQQRQGESGTATFVEGSSDLLMGPMGCAAAGGIAMGLSPGLGMGAENGSKRGIAAGVMFPVSLASRRPMAVGAGGGDPSAGFGAMSGERGLSSLSADTPSGAASQRGSRARRRSLLSKDSSHEESSVGAPMSTSGATVGAASLRTPSITSGMNPTSNSNMRATAASMAAAAAAAAAVAASVATVAPPAPSPTYSPAPPILHAVSEGAAPELCRGHNFVKCEETRSSPLQLHQAPSATLLDMNISGLLNDIQTQPVITNSDTLMFEECTAKRIRSNVSSSQAAPFRSEHNTFINNNMKHNFHDNSDITTTNICSSQVLGSSPLEGDMLPSQGFGDFHRQKEAGGGGMYDEPTCDIAPFDALMSRNDGWSTEMSIEQMLNLRKQSTGLSGIHTHIAEANTNNTFTGNGATTAMIPSGCGGAPNSRGSSTSQLDLLVELLGQPDGLERMDRMEHELVRGDQSLDVMLHQHQDQDIDQQLAFPGVVQVAQSSDVDSMQV